LFKWELPCPHCEKLVQVEGSADSPTSCPLCHEVFQFPNPNNEVKRLRAELERLPETSEIPKIPDIPAKLRILFHRYGLEPVYENQESEHSRNSAQWFEEYISTETSNDQSAAKKVDHERIKSQAIPPRQPTFGFEVPSEHELRSILSPHNEDNPFHGHSGDKQAVRAILDLAHGALLREDHDASDLCMILIGPDKSARDVSRKFVSLLDLPCVVINPAAVKTTHGLYLKIARACADESFEYANGRVTTLELLPQEDERHFCTPRMIVVVREAEKLDPDLVTGLIGAFETGKLATNKGITLDTGKVCWIVASSKPEECWWMATSQGQLLPTSDFHVIRLG
jgi:phage FluMu protein Com